MRLLAIFPATGWEAKRQTARPFKPAGNSRQLPKKVMGIRPDDIVFSTEKMSLASGLDNAMTCPMSVGATSILVPAWPAPEDVLAVFRERRPTVLCCVPAVYATIVEYLRKRPEGADRIRCCISVGETVPAEVARRWNEVFGVDILVCDEYTFAGRKVFHS